MFLISAYPDLTPKEIDDRLEELANRYITEVKTGVRDQNTDITEFNKTIKDKSPNTRAQRFSTVKIFFDMNGIEVNSRIWKNITRTGKKKFIRAISKEHIPSREELSRILKHLPLHGKTAALMLVSSGMRPGEPFELRLDQIDLDQKIIKIELEPEQTKTAQARYVYISDEAKGYLTEWLEYRETFMESVKNKARGLGRESVSSLSDRVFPFTLSNLRILWNKALEKAKLAERDKTTGRHTMPLKILRKYFRTRGDWSKSSTEIAEFLMGHIAGSVGQINGKNGDLVRVYARYQDTPDIVLRAYLDAEPSLTIVSSLPEVNQLREENVELEKIAQSKGDAILEKSDLIKYLQRDIALVRSENIKLREEVTGLRDFMLGLAGYIEMVAEAQVWEDMKPEFMGWREMKKTLEGVKKS